MKAKLVQAQLPADAVDRAWTSARPVIEANPTVRTKQAGRVFRYYWNGPRSTRLEAFVPPAEQSAGPTAPAAPAPEPPGETVDAARPVAASRTEDRQIAALQGQTPAGPPPEPAVPPIARDFLLAAAGDRPGRDLLAVAETFAARARDFGPAERDAVERAVRPAVRGLVERCASRAELGTVIALPAVFAAYVDSERLVAAVRRVAGADPRAREWVTALRQDRRVVEPVREP